MGIIGVIQGLGLGFRVAHVIQATVFNVCVGLRWKSCSPPFEESLYLMRFCFGAPNRIYTIHCKVIPRTLNIVGALLRTAIFLVCPIVRGSILLKVSATLLVVMSLYRGYMRFPAMNSEAFAQDTAKDEFKACATCGDRKCAVKLCFQMLQQPK